jgi:hypothetical protein
MAYEPQYREPGLADLPAYVTLEGDRETFTYEVSNRDQFGAQRRQVVVAIAEAMGATTSWTAVKNASGTGNDAFLITVTGGRRRTWQKIDADRIVTDVLMLPDVIAKAKAEAKAAEGATANTVQKAWKKAARNYVLETGLRKVERIAAAKTRHDFLFA